MSIVPAFLLILSAVHVACYLVFNNPSHMFLGSVMFVFALYLENAKDKTL